MASLTREEDATFTLLDISHNGTAEESEECLPFIYPYLTPVLKEKAKVYLNETEEIKQKCLKEFRDFIHKKKNLRTRTDDMFLLAFLRARKYDLEKTYALFLSHWKMRIEYKYYFEDINPESVKSLLLRNFLGLLHQRDRSGSVIIVFKTSNWNPRIDYFKNLYLGIGALLSLAIENDATQITGIRVIFDLRGLSWTQMKYCTPSNIYMLVRCTQFCFPARFKGVHMIGNSFFKIIWAITYPLLTKKLKERMYVHGADVKQLLKFIHPSVLPVEYGGDAPTFETTKWADYINERIQGLIEHTQYGFTD